ncbi:hypothetical protein M0R45_005172 [Rubus argutus]|uniref:Knottins-like domain-containing protein n=1 Tax=Rubus argutus TaxID=59490 RepID=A0AAW1YLT8_RUBAR
MDRSMRLAAFVLVVVLIMATEMGTTMVAEGKTEAKGNTGAKVNPRTCESQSSKFKGLCVMGSNCATTCKTEGFLGGHCRDFVRKCYCTKHC